MGLILAIDDPVDPRVILRKQMERRGHQTSEADTAEAALALLVTEKPDLIIVDGMMPGMNGVEFIRLVRAKVETAAIPIILYTAISDQTFLDNAMEKGANEIWIEGSAESTHMQGRVEHYIPWDAASSSRIRFR